MIMLMRGFFAYHAVPTNFRALSAFRHNVIELWRRALLRRSQKDRTSWTHMDRLADRWLPKPRISHPPDIPSPGYPIPRISLPPDIPSLAVSALSRQTPKVGAACGNSALTVLGGGRSVMGVPCTLRLTRWAPIFCRAARKAVSLIRPFGHRTRAVDKAPLFQAPLFMPNGIQGRGTPLIPRTRWSDADPCGVYRVYYQV